MGPTGGVVKDGVGPENPNCTGVVGVAIEFIIRSTYGEVKEKRLDVGTGVLFDDDKNVRNIPP